ncbi:hypothetical protein ymoll0001_38070 [Yersinia mollaretii ATCC 43969]|uniref:Lipoprotein n=1 Tax=Yersinia mollaretii (strain ATCC 43969 / DSM 18520 / CIP 103324 / CNY 7263 / WAIP 204) TaxID=349967 RepID=A0ABM9Y676_YERMW|nr:hypothetical protein ymoll0001_38070 [Yersinia mollaretii ATCC 43969]
MPLIALLYGCGDHTDRALDPPPDAKWVNVAFRVPEGTTLLPMEVLYRSERCKTVRYNSSNEPHDILGYNNFEKPYSQQGSSNIWQTRIAVDGGGSCKWQLNSLKVSFKIADDNPLVQGKEVIETNYIFDFGDYGFSDGYGTGRAKEASGDLDLKTDFFPRIFINHVLKKTSLKFFGGDTKYEKWSRRYRLYDTQKIVIEPVVHLNKLVVLESPNPPSGDIMATYPDGSSGKVQHIDPNYEKLLSMK